MAWKLEKTALQGGTYQGILSNRGNGSTTPPDLVASHDNAELSDMKVAPIEDAENEYMVRLSLPMELITDGIQTVVIRDRDSGETMDSVVVSTGAGATEDLHAEVDLMRAELEMLKSAFRRHMSSLT